MKNTGKLKNQIGAGLIFVLHPENKGTSLLGKNLSVISFLLRSQYFQYIFIYSTFLSPILLVNEMIHHNWEISGDSFIILDLYLRQSTQVAQNLILTVIWTWSWINVHCLCFVSLGNTHKKWPIGLDLTVVSGAHWALRVAAFSTTPPQHYRQDRLCPSLSTLKCTTCTGIWRLSDLHTGLWQAKANLLKNVRPGNLTDIFQQVSEIVVTFLAENWN